ncbi:inositol-trisphosphate 3-kinase homolog [Microplitis demolitor]|uniref:inositol-trisphosphate 3-kinase homolog n=1 Tax=Microplitis demolitor TaxID=69319 RepID=UPI0004CDA6C7|nr:inositol-trisphosphate 3-kinase homolog [Microplitis demolitor]
MSSGVCHASISPGMETFSPGLCIKVVDPYESILQSRLSQPTKSPRNQQRVNNETSNSKGSYSVLRQCKKNDRDSKCNMDVNLIDDVKTSSLSSSLPNVNYTPLGQFPRLTLDEIMPEIDNSLKFLALNALDLKAPASDILKKNRLKSWFQLSGHPDGLAPAGPGTVWKRLTGGTENTERAVYEELSKDDKIRDLIPKYYREVDYNGDTFIELQDLLFGFTEPCVIDIKLGTRTFLESEVSNTKARHDLYKKMISVDPNAPTKSEHENKAVTKLRYMQFREQESSTCSHGFRVEAMKFPGAPPITDLKKIKQHADVVETLRIFFGKHSITYEKLLEHLKDMRSRIEVSPFFQTHEVIGSSIFIIYDEKKIGAWLIDFAKTSKVPEGMRLTHRAPWQEGNREEGFLYGIDKLISTLEEIKETL